MSILGWICLGMFLGIPIGILAIYGILIATFANWGP